MFVSVFVPQFSSFFAFESCFQVNVELFQNLMYINNKYIL